MSRLPLLWKFISPLLLIIFASSTLYSQTSIWSWGDNGYGELGSGAFLPSGTGSSTPAQISALSTATAVSCGSYFSLALLANKTVMSWGQNNQGQLGNSTVTSSSPAGIASPALVSGLSNVVAISAGGDFAIALKADGTVWAWGRNREGELGNGNFSTVSPYAIATPAQVIGLSSIIAIAAGDTHGLALKSDGTVWSWGKNNNGQLGNGVFTTAAPSGIATPAAIPGLANVVSLAGGGSTSYAITADGNVWSWGYNYYGELCNGTVTGTGGSQGAANPTPAQTVGLSNVGFMVSRGQHCLALKNYKSLYDWGYNIYGQLGIGSFGGPLNNSYASPSPVNGFINVISASGGLYHSLALKADNTLWSWGYNYEGELGNGSITNAPDYGINTPAQVPSLNNIVSIASGQHHNLAVRANSIITLTNTIHLQGWQGAQLPIAFISIDGGPMVGYQITPINSTSGTISMQLSSTGTHTVKIKVDSYLAQKVAVTATGSSAAVNFNGPNGSGLLPGDTNNDGVIDDIDLLSVINNFLNHTRTGDTNGDVVVDDLDLLNVINNFLATGDV